MLVMNDIPRLVEQFGFVPSYVVIYVEQYACTR